MVDVPGRARDRLVQLQQIFPNMNIILMARNKKGVPTFYGRPDVVNGLGDAALSGVEWKEYDVEALEGE